MRGMFAFSIDTRIETHFQEVFSVVLVSKGQQETTMSTQSFSKKSDVGGRQGVGMSVCLPACWFSRTLNGDPGMGLPR